VFLLIAPLSKAQGIISTVAGGGPKQLAGYLRQPEHSCRVVSDNAGDLFIV